MKPNKHPSTENQVVSQRTSFLSKQDFTGTGKVFQFTLIQMLKNKSNVVSLLIMFLLALVSVPLITLLSGNDSLERKAECPISTIYYSNQTEYPVDFEKIPEKDSYFQGISIVDMAESPYTIEQKEDWSSLLNSDEAILHVYQNETDETYYTSVILSNMVEDDSIVFYLSDVTTTLFEEARYVAMGATEEQLEILMREHYTDVYTMKEFWDMQESDLNWEAVFAVQYGYSILILILCMMSAGFIIRAIIEEKASKLVELLMVSVQPLAMIVGKIFAVMTYVFAMLFCMLLGFVLSYFLTGLFTNASSVGNIMELFGMTPDVLNIGPFTLVIILLSLVLGYFTFSIIGGLAGACCSSMDDVESANMSVVLIALFGYIIACIATAFESEIVANITCILPIVSIFCAPVQYVCGSVGFEMLVLAWILQAIVLLALAWFSAKMYRDLIMHRGNRIKMKELFSIAFGSARKEM